MTDEFEQSMYRNPADLLQMLLERSQTLYTQSYNIGGFPLDVYLMGSFADGRKTGHEYKRCISRAIELGNDIEKQDKLIQFVNWTFDLINYAVENGLSPRRTSNNSHSMLMEFIAIGVDNDLLKEETINDIFSINEETNFMVMALETAKNFKREFDFLDLDNVDIIIRGTDKDGKSHERGISLDLSGDEDKEAEEGDE